MATFTKFNCFVEDVAEKKHDLGADTLKVLLTNTAPNAADTIVDTSITLCTVKSTSNAPEMPATGGYTKGGNQAAISSSAQSGGLYKLVLADPALWTATAGGIGPFRYAVLYNDTAGAAAARLPIGFWDYGVGGVTLAVGETFLADMDPTTGVLTLQ
jgi:hypothetical protein